MAEDHLSDDRPDEQGEIRDAIHVDAAQNLRRREAWSAMIIEEMGEKDVALIGGADDVTRYLERFVKIGVRYFTLGFVPIRGAQETIRRMQVFAEKVMPKFA